jgi:transcriptional regulator with XRE-family HTH domain
VLQAQLRPPIDDSKSDFVNILCQGYKLITGNQIRMARAALKWGVRELASRAEVTAATVTRIESGKGSHATTLNAIRLAFEQAGLEFIPENGGGVGVRFSRPEKKSE